jgi:hypothetical protein
MSFVLVKKRKETTKNGGLPFNQSARSCMPRYHANQWLSTKNVINLGTTDGANASKAGQQWQ